MASALPEPDPVIPDLAAFHACALAIEAAAARRYRELAARMEAAHHHAVVPLFQALAAMESAHAEQLRQRLGVVPGSPAMQPVEAVAGLPETVREHELPATIMPADALALARANEERAAAFYESVAGASPDPAVRALAREFASEERRHAQMVARVLGMAPDPGPDWLNDPAPDHR
jgi:rubrerythrin